MQIVVAGARTMKTVLHEKKKHEKSPVPVQVPSVEIEEPPLVKKNKPQKSPMLVRTTGPEEEDSVKHVTIPCITIGSEFHNSPRLLVFNVHGILLDCSFILECNPNSKIKSIFQSTNRRVTLRPWLLEFLFNCFKKYIVAFWGTKNKNYMDEVVPAMLDKVKDNEAVVLAFVWSQRNYEVIQWCGNDPVSWRCLLESIYRTFLVGIPPTQCLLITNLSK